MSDTSELPHLNRIINPVLRRLQVGQVPLVLVSHPGELPPDDLYQAVTDRAKAAGIETVEERLDGFDPYLIAAMEVREERLFSIVCPSSSVDPPVHPRLLNMTRTRWLESKKGLILWVPHAGMRILSLHASNFLDCRDTYVDLEDIVFPPAKINFSHLPQSSIELVGRQQELQNLDHYLADPQIAVTSLVADGGVGKSALVREWLEQQAFEGIARVFGWSFYSQGSHDTQTSSNQFFSAALAFFGHRGALPNLEESKAARLVELLQSQPAILILDGVEPLQYPVQTLEGHFSDTGLFRLMRQLAKRGLGKYGENGLVVITSRQPIQEFAKHKNTVYRETNLNTLTEEDGAKLLQALGVHGPVSELHDTSQKMHGHALALVLLGSLLAEQYKGDIARQDQINELFATKELGDHARRVMAYYDESLWAKDGAERALLRLLGLFDRPIEEKVFQVLRQQAHIALPLQELSSTAFNKLVANLEKAGLLLVTEHHWDAHPLVREYFGHKFKQEDPENYRQAHRLLFEYFQSVPEDDLPDTLEKLEPLYRAVHHGCQAGEYKKAMEDVYIRQIHRSQEYFSLYTLGAFSSDLALLSGFFPNGWGSEPVHEELSEQDCAWLLGSASFCLMSLGRMREAIWPRQQSIKIGEQYKDWKYSSNEAQNLCSLQLSTGELRLAMKTTKMAITWAEKSADSVNQIISLTLLASTLHQLGEMRKSQIAFRDAEKQWKKQHPNQRQLRGFTGKLYCDLLLDQSEERSAWEAILDRRDISSQKLEHQSHILNKAMDILSHSRALDALERDGLARQQLDRAVTTIRQSGSIHYTPEFLLHRAAFLRQQEEREPALQDLEEALEISIRCGMDRYEADGRLLEGHFFLDDNKEKEAEQALLRAETLIEQMSYGRQIAEVQMLRARWLHHTGDSREAQWWLERARLRIAEIGQLGLKRAWEQIAIEMGERLY